MLETSILKAREYNSISRFEDQVHALPSVLVHGLRYIFRLHGMHSTYGIELLHRHHDLEPDHVMFHTTTERIDICESKHIESLQWRGVIPCSFYLNANRKFQAFEYQAGVPDSTPNETFLRDVRKFLYKHRLDRVIAISRISPLDQGVFVEYTLPLRCGTVALKCQVTDARWTADGHITTGWAFANGNELVSEYKKCVRTESGGHLVKTK